MNVFAMIRQTKDPKNKKILNVLPTHEKVVYELYFHERVKQAHIAKFMKVTQGAISHRLKKSMKRLRYTFTSPTLTTEEKRHSRNVLTSFIYDLCLFMAQTTCQTEVAELLNEKYKLTGKNKMNQVKVRYKFNKTINKLKVWSKSDPKLKSILSLCEHANNNIYTMRWVSLPQFKKHIRIPKKLTKEVVLRRISRKK